MKKMMYRSNIRLALTGLSLLALSCDPPEQDSVGDVGGDAEFSDLGEGAERPRSAEFFDDFARRDSAELGTTPVGDWAWESGERAVVLEGEALKAVAAADQEIGWASLRGFTLQPGRLTLDLALESDGVARIELGSVRLEVGEIWLRVVGEKPVEVALPSGSAHALELVVTESSLSVWAGERLVLDGEEVLTAGGELRFGLNANARIDAVGFVPQTEEARNEGSGSGAGGADSGAASAPSRSNPDAPSSSQTFTTPGGGDGGGGGGGGGEEDVIVVVPEPPRGSAPAQDLTVPTTLHKMVAHLYEGGAQTGADLGVLAPSSISLVHGVIRDAWGQPVSGATIYARGKPEYGFTTSRTDGTYDFVIAGGRHTDIVVSDAAFLTAQRSTEVEVGDAERLDDVILIEVDPESSVITFQDPIEVHHAFTPNDGWADRMMTLMFRGGTQATMVFGDGSTQPLPSMTVRMTEFTVGVDGIERMPSKLPPATAYNFALEISADEAEAAQAVSVELDTPAAMYVDNYRNFPVGSFLPNGSFDRVDGRWHPEPTGVVLEVVGVTGGLADVDVTGDGVADTGADLTNYGITDPEREELASIYSVGAELWRVEINHFTPFDVNPSGETGGYPPNDGEQPQEQGLANSCEMPGSIIEVESRVLGETVPLHGTPFSLNYRSSRVPGGPNRSITVEVNDPDPPPGLNQISLIVEVAGRRMVHQKGLSENNRLRVNWDGLDAFGRRMQGAQPITMCIAYGYLMDMLVPVSTGSTPTSSSHDVRFGQSPEGAFQVHLYGGAEQYGWYSKCYGNEKSVAAAAAQSITKADRFRLGGLDAALLSDGLGGWTLDAHHTLSRATGILHRGDGRDRELADEAVLTASRFAGAQEEGLTTIDDQGFIIGSDPNGVLMPAPDALAAGPDGEIYVGSAGLVRRIDQNGVSVVAGTYRQVSGQPEGWVNSSSPAEFGFDGDGDGGLAELARLGTSIPAVSADENGGLYIADGGRVRYVDRDGAIETVAGGGTDPSPAARFPDPLSVDMGPIMDLTVLPDGDGVLIASMSGGDPTVRLLTLDGELEFLAGTPEPAWVDLDNGFSDCTAALCGADSPNQFGGPTPYDWIPVLDEYIPAEDREKVGRGIYARINGDLRSVGAAGGRVFFAEVGSSDRVRVLSGYRGGKISTYRERYRLGAGFVLPFEPALLGRGVAVDTDLNGVDDGNIVLEADPNPPTVVDLLASDSGLHYTTPPEGGTNPGGLYFVTEDLDAPPIRLMGAPGAGPFLGGDGLRLADQVGLGAFTEVVRGKDGALYVADRQRNVILRVARMVPPMYLSSWVTSADGTEIYLFDEEGRHLETRDARTHALVHAFGYDGDGLLSTVSDAHNRTTTIQRSQGTVTGVMGPDGVTTAITVDANGYLDTITDASAAVIDLDHGPTGLLEAMSDSNSLTEFEYDTGGALLEDRHTVVYSPPSGGTEAEVITKDVVPLATAGPESASVQHISPELRETTYWFERNGTNVEREVTFPDQTQNTSSHTPERDQVTFADGTIITTEWEADERLGANTRAPSEIRVQTPDNLLRETTFVRSFEPRCSIYAEEAECVPPLPPEGAQDRRLRADRIVETVQSGTQTWTSTYDRAHLEAGSPVPAQIVAVAPTGRSTATTLNDAGQVASVQVGSLAPVVYGYDLQGRVTSISQTDGVQTRVVTFGYATNGWLETVTDAQNRTTTFQRDAVGRILQQISPVPSEVIGFTYDEDGNVTSVTPPSRPAHDFYYDSANRLREYAPPAVTGAPDPETRYTYTPDHQTDDTSLPQGSSLDFQYDGTTGKLTFLDTPEGDYTFTYDDGIGDTGKLETLSVAQPDVTIGTLTLSYTYDGDLVTEEALTAMVAGVEGVVGWGYDDQLRLDEETVEGDTVTYGYDSSGRLTTMGALTATYDPDTDLLATTTLGTVETTHSYSPFGDLAGVLYEAANTSFYEVSYTRDEFGRVQTKTETRPGSSNLRCYEYDASDRLAGVFDAADSNGCTGSQLEAYTYDLNGNRASVTNSAGTISAANIVTDDQDRLLQHGAVAYTYNEDGQMQTRTDGSGTWNYTYDAVGNLVEVDPPGTDPTITYVIDPRNRRVGKRENGTLVQGFLYGGQLKPIAELDGSGAVVSRFVYGTSDHVPDYMIRGGVTYRFVADHLGSVVGVYDLTNGVEVQTREYDAYGQIVAETTTPGFSQPFGFAGGLYDEGTGLVRFGARDYRPEVGAWAAKDPLRFGAGDGSLFSYCYGDPANHVDRDGLDPSPLYLDPHEAARAWADRYYYGLGDEFTSREVCTPIFFVDVPFLSVPVRFYYYDAEYNHVGHESGCRPFRFFKDGMPPEFAWGDCHTHGSDDPGFVNEEMSWQDKTSCVDRTKGTGRCWTFTPKQKCIYFERGRARACPE